MTEARPAPREKDFVFKESDFKRVRELIYHHAGISLAQSKQQMVYSRLSRRLRALKIDSFQEYLDALQADAASSEWEAFINALTTNLTSFFREGHHFQMLAKHLAGRHDEITIWCSASSTGEEPYSIAMTVVEALGWNARARIVASDIDTNVLAQAQAGVYTFDRVEKLSPERLRRFFLKGQGANEGLVKVKPELRALIEFIPLNLLAEKWPLARPFDAIFCRNVMIYFDKPTQSRILSRFVPLVKPGGLLFAGHSENFTYITKDFSLIEKTVYQLTGNRDARKSA